MNNKIVGSLYDNVIAVEESKFEDGVLRADGITQRYEAHGKETMTPEAQVFSHFEEAAESRQLNQWHMLISKFGQGSASMFKTPEVRRAELDVLLLEE